MSKAMMYKILIVDDSKLARMSLTKTINALLPEWTGVEASNADEALALMASERPNIAIMDFNMPGRDGLALAAELHALDPDLPLAVISANIQDEIVARTRKLGAAFLPKPLTQQVLADFLSGAQMRLKRTGT
jgi:DNA-binding NarL/FixJ family response regulator